MPGSLGTLLVKLRADTAQFQAAMSSSQKVMAGFKSSMLAVGGAITAVGGLITGLGVKSIRTAANFEAGMARVRAVAQATPEDFNTMRKAALDLAAGTKFTATEVSEGMKFMAMAGIQTRDIIGGIPAVLDLAAAGAIEMGTASDIVTNIMAGFGKTAEELGSSVDVVVKAITSANVDVEQLGESFKYVGPIAKSAGLSFEETTAAIALMGNAGIQGSMAGTSLRRAISNLVNPTDQVKKALNEMGVQVTDSNGRLLSLTSIVAQMQPYANDTGRIMQIFGDRAGPAMAALLGMGSDALDKLTGKLRESGGIAKSIAQSEMATFAGQLKILESRFERVQISIGQSLMPIARELLGWAEKAASLFGSLSDETKKWIFGLGAAGTAVGALALAFSILGGAVVPLALIAGALAGIILGVGIVKKAWQSDFGYIRTITTGVVKGIAIMFSWLWDQLKAGIKFVVDAHIKMFGMLADALKKITFGKVDFTDMFDVSADDMFGDLGEGLKDALGKGLETAKDGAKVVGEFLSDSFKEGLSTVGGVMKDAASGLLAMLPRSGGIGGGGASTPTQATSATASTRNEPMAGGIPDISEKIQPIIDEQAASWAAVGETFNSALSNLSQGATTAANNYLQSQVAAGQISQEAASRMAANTQEAIDVMSAAMDGFAKGGIIGAVTGAFSSLFSKSSAFGKVVSKLGTLFSGLMKALEPVFRTLANALQPLFKALSSILAPIASLLQVLSILAPLFKLVGKIFEVVGTILYAFAWVIASVWNFLLDIVASIVGIFSKSWARDVRKQKIHVSRELAEEDNTSATDENTDATRRNTTQVHEFGETVESVNEELGNVPDAFKIANARFNAIDGVTSDITTPPAEGSGGAFSGATINIIAQDPEEAYDRLQDAAAKRSFESSGTTIVRGNTHGTGTTG